MVVTIKARPSTTVTRTSSGVTKIKIGKTASQRRAETSAAKKIKKGRRLTFRERQAVKQAMKSPIIEKTLGTTAGGAPTEATKSIVLGSEKILLEKTKFSTAPSSRQRVETTVGKPNDVKPTLVKTLITPAAQPQKIVTEVDTLKGKEVTRAEFGARATDIANFSPFVSPTGSVTIQMRDIAKQTNVARIARIPSTVASATLRQVSKVLDSSKAPANVQRRQIANALKLEQTKIRAGTAKNVITLNIQGRPMSITPAGIVYSAALTVGDAGRGLLKGLASGAGTVAGMAIATSMAGLYLTTVGGPKSIIIARDMIANPTKYVRAFNKSVTALGTTFYNVSKASALTAYEFAKLPNSEKKRLIKKGAIIVGKTASLTGKGFIYLSDKTFNLLKKPEKVGFLAGELIAIDKGLSKMGQGLKKASPIAKDIIKQRLSNMRFSFRGRKGAVFRGGVRKSPKSRAEIRKASLKQQIDPRVTFDKGEKIIKGKKGLKSREKLYIDPKTGKFTTEKTVSRQIKKTGRGKTIKEVTILKETGKAPSIISQNIKIDVKGAAKTVGKSIKSKGILPVQGRITPLMKENIRKSVTTARTKDTIAITESGQALVQKIKLLKQNLTPVKREAIKKAQTTGLDPRVYSPVLKAEQKAKNVAKKMGVNLQPPKVKPRTKNRGDVIASIKQRLLIKKQELEKTRAIERAFKEFDNILKEQAKKEAEAKKIISDFNKISNSITKNINKLTNTRDQKNKLLIKLNKEYGVVNKRLAQLKKSNYISVRVGNRAKLNVVPKVKTRAKLSVVNKSIDDLKKLNKIRLKDTYSTIVALGMILDQELTQGQKQSLSQANRLMDDVLKQDQKLDSLKRDLKKVVEKTPIESKKTKEISLDDFIRRDFKRINERIKKSIKRVKVAKPKIRPRVKVKLKREEELKKRRVTKKKPSKSKKSTRKTRFTKTLLGAKTGTGTRKKTRIGFTGLERRA